jgi:pyruvate formate lyase activating enzyme
MDIKTDPHGYAPLICRNAEPQDLLTSVRSIIDSGLPHEFRTTCLRPFVDAAIVQNIARLIRGAALYALQRFHPAEVLHPEFFLGAERLIGDGELSRFKALAETEVQRCIIR